MNRYHTTKGLFICIVFTLFFICSSFLVAADGGSAGVGVINVPPNYADIKIFQQDNQIRVYLTLSDYNSWSDIYKVQLNLEEDGAVLHTFSFKQWDGKDSFNRINEFIDESSTSLLNREACDVSHSRESKTIADRCHLHVRFVFQTTYFSQIRVTATDRAGVSTEAFVEYKGSDMIRDSNTLLIPWFDGAVKIELPPFVLDISILLIAMVATILIGRKTPLATTLQQVFYEPK
ncbi:MAG: hypothetical protein QCI00_00535 [Candidatus Thermoplasmatota archaeon]|nr:hypothetical protein [Candidatus Thermoplasmatota archaeon]